MSFTRRGWRAAGRVSRVLSLLPACALAAALCRNPELHITLVLSCMGGLRWLRAALMSPVRSVPCCMAQELGIEWGAPLFPLLLLLLCSCPRRTAEFLERHLFFTRQCAKRNVRRR